MNKVPFIGCFFRYEIQNPVTDLLGLTLVKFNADINVSSPLERNGRDPASGYVVDIIIELRPPGNLGSTS